MPAEKNQDVMEMVRKELSEDPNAETKALFEKAKEMDSSLEDLSLRQFHARYPLQVKRKMSSKKKEKKGKKAGGSRKKSPTATRTRKRGTSASADGREAIREGLLRFAKDVADADSKADLITVLTSVDDYVDDVTDALEKA